MRHNTLPFRKMTREIVKTRFMYHTCTSIRVFVKLLQLLWMFCKIFTWYLTRYGSVIGKVSAETVRVRLVERIEVTQYRFM